MQTLHEMGDPSHTTADAGWGTEWCPQELHCLSQQCCSAASPGHRQKMRTSQVHQHARQPLGGHTL